MILPPKCSFFLISVITVSEGERETPSVLFICVVFISGIREKVF